MKLLIIDDDKLDRQSIKRVLRELPSLTISEVDSASDALFQIKNVVFDIILMDYRLPDRDGLALLSEIQSLKLSRPSAIVMMSNSEDENLMRNALEFGAQDFIPKRDISSARLQRCILLARKRFELEYYVLKSVEQTKLISITDKLTGIRNRYAFENALDSIVPQCSAGKAYTVVFIDIDNFKFFNESYGHETGDELLRQVAERLKSSPVEYQELARVGSNEFAVLIDIEKQKLQPAQIVSSLVKSLANRYEVNGHPLNCTFSVGFWIAAQSATDKRSIIKYTNLALKRAKSRQGSSVVEFDKSMLKEVDRRLLIKNGLKEHCESNAFQVHYQPLLNSSGEICSFESLVRWPQIHNQTTFRPDEFIPIAEQSGDIHRLGRNVFSQAVDALAELTNKFGYQGTMSVNVSPVQLNQWDLCEVFTNICNKYGIPPNRIIIEITETALLCNDHATQNMIDLLASNKFIIALDDFGTGFSSVSHLLNYPITIMKVDRSVLPSELDDKKRINLLKSLITMGKSIGVKVVVEGVETQWQAGLCESFNCDKMQGYYFSKPLGKEDVVQCLSENFNIPLDFQVSAITANI